MAYLSTNNGPNEGQRIKVVDPRCILGRHPDCHVVIEEGAVSRHHAQIIGEQGNYFLEDLGSRNGTFLNDEPVLGRTLLKDGDGLRVCDIAFTFSIGQEIKPKTPPENKQTVRPGKATTLTGRSHQAGFLLSDEPSQAQSTIMSTLDVSSHYGGQISASPEVKLAALLDIIQSLGKAVALDEVLPQVLSALFKIFLQADRGFIVLREADGSLVPRWRETRRKEADDSIHISRTIINKVMDSKEAILSADAASDMRFEMSQSVADFRIRSMMCAPLVNSDGHAIGALQIDTLDQRHRFQETDLEVLVSVAAQAATAIDKARLHEDALRQKELERDLEVAHEVQLAFLPKQSPSIEGYEFFHYYESADFIGGDYYDYIPLPDGRTAVVVADVVGHGVAAALLMGKLSAETRAALAASPEVSGAAITNLNNALSRLSIDRFVTFLLAIVDHTTHEVVIVNAGHMAPILRRGVCKIEEPGEDLAGLPLGIVENMDYQQKTIKLEPGEFLTMYTDGINEACNAAGEYYTIDRIRGHVGGAAATPLRAGRVIVNDVLDFLGDSPQGDDMCLVCFGRTA